MAFAPAPDFRYVGLEPITAPRLGVAMTSLGLGAGVTLAMSTVGMGHAVLAGAVASLLSAFALRGTGSATLTTGSARMAIVPWGVLVEIDDTPRILRWAAIRTIDVQTSRARRLLVGPAVSSRVAISTERDRFVGAAVGSVPLEQLVEHVGAYASEQGTPIALALDGLAGRAGNVDVVEPGAEMLIASVREWLASAAATADSGSSPRGTERRPRSRRPRARSTCSGRRSAIGRRETPIVERSRP